MSDQPSRNYNLGYQVDFIPGPTTAHRARMRGYSSHRRLTALPERRRVNDTAQSFKLCLTHYS